MSAIQSAPANIMITPAKAEFSNCIDMDQSARGNSVEKRRRKSKKMADTTSNTKLGKSEFYIDKILDKQVNAKYLVKWHNYSEKHNTWEPLEHLNKCEKMLRKFERNYKRDHKKRRSRKKHETRDAETSTSPQRQTGNTTVKKHETRDAETSTSPQRQTGNTTVKKHETRDAETSTSPQRQTGNVELQTSNDEKIFTSQSVLNSKAGEIDLSKELSEREIYLRNVNELENMIGGKNVEKVVHDFIRQFVVNNIKMLFSYYATNLMNIDFENSFPTFVRTAFAVAQHQLINVPNDVIHGPISNWAVLISTKNQKANVEEWRKSSSEAESPEVEQENEPELEKKDNKSPKSQNNNKVNVQAPIQKLTDNKNKSDISNITFNIELPVENLDSVQNITRKPVNSPVSTIPHATKPNHDTCALDSVIQIASQCRPLESCTDESNENDDVVCLGVFPCRRKNKPYMNPDSFSNVENTVSNVEDGREIGIGKRKRDHSVIMDARIWKKQSEPLSLTLANTNYEHYTMIQSRDPESV